MKKSVANNSTNIQLNTKKLFSNYQSVKRNEDVKRCSAQTKPKQIQPRTSKDVEFEMLSFPYDNANSKIGNKSKASASTSFNTDVLIRPKPYCQNVKVFQQENSGQLRYLARRNADEMQSNASNTFKFKEKRGYTFQYPVERIELSKERKTMEEIESVCNVNLIESFFTKPSVRDSPKEGGGGGGKGGREKKLYRLGIKSPREIIKRNLSATKKNFQRNIGRLCGRLCKWKSVLKESQRQENKIKIKRGKGSMSGVVPVGISPPEVDVEEDLETKRQLLDFYIYIIYLAFITAIALCMVSSNMFYFTNITTSLFFDTKGPVDLFGNSKTLRESMTLEDFWAFAETTLLNLLYWNFYYTRLDPATHSPDDDRKMLYGNQILGVARIRQVRVKSDSCEIHPNVKRFFNECYFYYSVFSEDTEPIKKDMKNATTATAWVYTEASTLKSSYYWGEISVYGGGGYYLDLATDQTGATAMIKELKDNFWISKATRAIFIDFNIYNANANLFCICKIVLEFPPIGGIIPVADFHSLKIIRYLTRLDFFILGCEFIYTIFVIYYSWQLIRTIITQKLSFFLVFWHYLDIAILLFSCVYICLSIIRHILSRNLVTSLKDQYDGYSEFHTVKTIQVYYNNTIAVLLFFCWIKLFKYFNFNTILLEFKITLARSLKDILGFFPMFLTMFLAFAFLAYLLFGNQVKTYNTLWLSFLTLLQAFLGEFYYTDIVESNRVLGPLFYIAYIFFIFFVLLNVFIAIINDAYTSVKSQVIYEEPKTGEYMKRGLMNIITCGRAHFNKKQRLKDTKKKLLFQEIETALKRAGFSTAEIKVFFYKYNINFSNFLDGNTRKRILEDVELKRIDFSETAEQFQINSIRRKLEELTNRMEDLETHLQPVVDKVDVLLQRL